MSALPQEKEIRWNKQIKNTRDGFETIFTLFGNSSPRLDQCFTVTPKEFELLGVHNHRAQLKKTLLEMFPEDDRPRGNDDIESVLYHLTTKSKVDPVMIYKYRNELTVVDGVHRLIAAYLLDLCD